MKKAFNNICILSTVIFCLVQCYEPTEGCLNPKAANYAIAADDQCQDCCTFPKLTVRFDYMYDTLPLSSSSFYQNIVGDSFKINEFFLTMSDFQLKTNQDSFTLISSNNTTLDTDAVITRLQSKNTIPGSFIINDTIKSISFFISLPDDFDNKYESYPTTNVYEYLLDSMYYDSEDGFFNYSGISIQTDTLDDAKIDLFFKEHYNGERIKIKVNDIIADRGISINVALKIDFKTLLYDIDLNNIPPTDTILIKNKILENLNSAIQLNDQ